MNLMINACDTKFFHYAKKMYTSFKQFNTTEMFFGNVDCSEKQTAELEGLGVHILATTKIDVFKKNKLSFNLLDLILYDFLENVNYDKIMWIDADTMILRNVEALFDFDVDFVGHPGRKGDGAIITTDNTPYFAMGLWVTRRKDFLKCLSLKINNLHNKKSDRIYIRSAIDELDLSFHQLDPSIWNFSRELVKTAEFDEQGIFYKVYPATIGFSLQDDMMRGQSEAVEDWYETYIEAYPISMKPKEKLKDLEKFAIKAEQLLGDFVELGVFKGGSAVILSRYLGNKTLCLADSFEGLPEPGENDIGLSGKRHKKGDICGTLDEVKSLRSFVNNDKIVFIEGWIVDSENYFKQFPERIALLHIDVDYEQPYRDILKHLYARVVKGGFIIFDDYGHYKGAKLAVDDFIVKTGEKLHRTGETSQYYVIKEKIKLCMTLDDFSEEIMKDEEWKALFELKKEYPDLKITMFTIPEQCSISWLKKVKEFNWIELAVHGTDHRFIKSQIPESLLDGYTNWFKAPRWKLTLEDFNRLRQIGYLVATNKTNAFKGDYVYDDGLEIVQDVHYKLSNGFFTWHGHVQSQKSCNSVNPNGLCDVIRLFKDLIPKNTDFLFVSEIV